MNKALRDIAFEDLSHLRAFSNIKVIAVDLDGTMSSSTNMEIWENVIWSINNINRNSRKKTSLIIATGRTFSGARKAIELLYQNRDLPIVLYNGSVVIRNISWEILYKKTITHHALRTIIELSDIYPVSVFAYCYLGGNKSLFDGDDKLEYVTGYGEDKTLKVEFNKMPIIWESEYNPLSNEPSAVLIDIKKLLPNQVESIIERLLMLQEISITSSGFAYIEIRPSGSNKAEALRFIAEEKGLVSSDFAAIGDNNNDAEMLRWVGTGIAVSNGTPSAQDAARYIASHDVASGVIEVLRLIKQSKRYHK